ncbi:MAG: hypothetical protein DRJ03_03365 [Chloroflexi bacterium]|nr:MAG: hypothetical protein DRJ03_03365 [Chloroflexota bacterium]
MVARVEEIATQQSLYQSHYKVLGERLAEHTQLLRARQQDFSDLLDAYEDFMVSQGQRPEGNIDAGQLKITDRDFFHLHASPKWREQLSNAHRQAHAARRQEEETRASFDMVSYKRQGLMVERREAAYRRDIALNPYLTPEKR